MPRVRDFSDFFTFLGVDISVRVLEMKLNEGIFFGKRSFSMDVLYILTL